MPKQVTLVEFPELLRYAETIGISWNLAHDILVKDEIPPMYECNSREYYINDFNADNDEYGYSDETKKIMKGFFEKHKLLEFTLVND